MKSIIIFGIILFLPVTAFAQLSFWKKWNKYSDNFDYGPSTTYVNFRSKVVVSTGPRIYSFDARLEEDGSLPEEAYKLLVNCTNKAIMDLSQRSSRKWIKATGKYARLVVDACS
jgi:hypothetical protein